MAYSLGAIVAEAWEQELRETPDPFCGDDWLFARLTGKPMPLYRTRLDRPVVNTYGEIVPRIVIVRRHLRALGSVRLDPARLR